MSDLVIPKVIPSYYTKKNDGNIAFYFRLPDRDLALRSVRVVNDVPEFTFEASRKVPTIQEADVATAFRLVYENKRPEFFYTDFPTGHPLRGRWFKRYSPTWLRWTGVGQLLADVDWNMKCLNVGTRSNEEKTKFWSWSSKSQLTGLANYEDFPTESVLFRSIIMSCKSAKLLKNENELMFPEEPKMMITDGGSKLYTKYISEILPSIAYYDEPKFLKMQELIKLILAVEWLHKEKDVQADFEWMMSHTSQPSYANSTQSKMEQTKRRQKPPSNMIPQPSECKQPTTDVTAATWEAGRNKAVITKCGIKRHYGYIDIPYQEVHLFEEDGTPFSPQKYLKCEIQCTTPIGEWTYFKSISISEKSECSEKMRKTAMKLLPQKDYERISHQLLQTPDSAADDENEVSMKISKSIFPSSLVPFPAVEDHSIVKATEDDYDLLYAGMNPNMPIMVSGGGITIPFVKSWNELVSDLSEVQPRVLKFPYHPMVDSMAGGGVSTRNIPVTESSLPVRAVHKPRQQCGVYSSSDSSLTLRATGTKIQGKIRVVRQNSEVFDKISAFFREKWISGKQRSPPFIHKIFIINNPGLRERWEEFKSELNKKNRPNESEMFFHGTTLACDIATSSTLCPNPECAICSISHNGMDRERAGVNNPENPRFGKGIYFALHSSKSDDYSKSTGKAKDYKAILMCDILLGKCLKTYEGDKYRDEKRGEYDSVMGELESKTSLPEILVHNPAAVLPRYIIVYQNIGDNSSGPDVY